MVFLPSPTLILPLLHLAQVFACQGDDCPTGLVITGGEEAATSVETFPANCSIPPFPEPGRYHHSLSAINQGKQLVACGGSDTEKSCISWQQGQEGWKDFHTLSKKRSYHAAVVMEDESIVIVGGYESSFTSGEIVPGGTVFNLQNGGYLTCAVKFQQELVMIGGSSGTTHGHVDRYDSQGKHLGSLPDLDTARLNQACANFVSSAGEVGLLVAGGSDINWDQLASTEVYLPSTGKWTSGGNLPRRLAGLRAAHLNQRVVVTGGKDDGRNYRDEVLEYDGSTWSKKKETLQTPRSLHTIVAANLPALCSATGLGESTTSATTSATSSATSTTGLDPLLALLTCLVLVCCRGCNNSCTLQGENKQSL